MLKLWGILRKNNKMIRNLVVENEDNSLSPEEQLNACMEEICYQFDIPKPIWLSKHQNEFEQFHRTVFKADHFIEKIDFDAFEIEAIIDKEKE